MPRALRIEYPGAIYHVMNRGDRREPIFREEGDYALFLKTLGEVCAKTDWQVHAYCLMRNHFHLALETPNANLVAGMKWFLGTYTSRFNRRHKFIGHLFSGRYKALAVDGSGDGYLKTVCDYVHLNPARAKLLSPEQSLREFRWSSWPEYLKGPDERPVWLRVERLLGEYRIAQDSEAGRAHLEQCLEQRRADEDGADYKTIRRGWCLGGESFRRELLDNMHARATESHHARTRQETTEEKARRILNEELGKLGWTAPELAQHAKGDARKVALARRLRTETAVTLKWIAAELHMGAWTHVSNLLANPPKPKAKKPTNQTELNLCQ